MSLILSGTNGLSDVDGSAATPAIRGTDTNTGIFFPAADTIAFAEGGAEVARFDSSGALQVGTTAAAVGTKANFYGTTTVLDSGGQLFVGVTDAIAADKGGQIMMGAYYTGTTITGMGGIAAKRENGSSGNYAGYLQFITSTNGSGNTEKARFDSAGNLGIGTTTPSSFGALCTRRGISVSGVTGSVSASFSDGANDTLYVSQDSSLSRLTFGALTFNTGTTERGRFDSSGNFLVGATSTVSGEKFHLASSTGSFTQRIYNSDASTPFGVYVRYTNANPSNTSSEFFRGDTNTQTRFAAQSNGGIANFSANNVNLSDRREKTNFAPAGDYLAKICAIPVQTFNFIDQDLENDGGLTLGVVAQDVQAVAPELVLESNWAASGAEPKMRLSIYQTDLQYALMKCIQEQQALIAQLQADVAALKGTQP